MCGICGILNLSLNPIPYPGRVEPMSERLNHRGPDSHGKFERPHVARGIRRVSISLAPHFERLPEYFLYGYFPAPHTAFSEIKKLPAAHVMVAERGETRLKSYWRLQEYLRPPGQSRLSKRQESTLVEELQERLR